MSMQQKYKPENDIRVGANVLVLPEHLNTKFGEHIFRKGVVTYINRKHQHFLVRFHAPNGMKIREDYKFCDIGRKVKI